MSFVTLSSAGHVCIMSKLVLLIFFIYAFSAWSRRDCAINTPVLLIICEKIPFGLSRNNSYGEPNSYFNIKTLYNIYIYIHSFLEIIFLKWISFLIIIIITYMFYFLEIKIFTINIDNNIICNITYNNL